MGKSVTIGIPVYNGEDGLRKAIESVLSQTIEDYVVHISDNCSTDRTKDILDEYEGIEKITITRHQENKGPIYNFKLLLSKCETPYFMWLAHDDFINDCFVENLIKGLDQNDEAVLAIPNFTLLNADGSCNESKTTKHKSSILKMPDSRYETAKMYANYPVAYWFYGLWRTEAIKDCYSKVISIWPALHDTEYPSHGDVLMIFNATFKGLFVHSDKSIHSLRLPSKKSGKGNVKLMTRIQNTRNLSYALYKIYINGIKSQKPSFIGGMKYLYLCISLTNKLCKFRNLTIRMLTHPLRILIRLF